MGWWGGELVRSWVSGLVCWCVGDGGLLCIRWVKSVLVVSAEATF